MEADGRNGTSMQQGAGGDAASRPSSAESIGTAYRSGAAYQPMGQPAGPRDPFAPPSGERFIAPPGPEPMPVTTTSGGDDVARSVAMYVAIWIAVLVVVLAGIFYVVFVQWSPHDAQVGGFVPYLFLFGSPVMVGVGALVALPFSKRFTAGRACIFTLLAFAVLTTLPAAVLKR